MQIPGTWQPDPQGRVMGVVLADGDVRPADTILDTPPDGPYRPLQPV
jgi:hypothetical protein